jgi:hypothetical protein
MITTFLAASDGTPLVKNLITNQSYPQVLNFNSFTHTCTDLDSLLTALKLHADQGNCLIKGELEKALNNESRAGKAKQQKTKLIVLDVDNDNLPFNTRDDFVNSIGFSDTSYIFQFSSKSKDDASIRGHYFFLLDADIATSDIKETIKTLNFQHLYDHLELSNNKLCLKWPLDITVNDNGKLIYLAPPIQETDPITKRFTLIKHNKDLLTFHHLTGEYNVQDTINELRGNEGLVSAPKPHNGYITVKPQEVRITDQKEDGDFIRLNLNGGDSWGYYFKIDQPETIYNFKEEPLMRLKDLDPKLYAQYHIKNPVGGSGLTVNSLTGELKQTKAIVFRDPGPDHYYQVKYDTVTNEVEEYNITSSKTRLTDFLVTNGEEPVKHVFDWKVEFNPPRLAQIEPTNKWFNLFKPTQYLEVTETIPTCPPYTEKLLRHTLVDDECYDHFVKWLAFILQTRSKAETCWLLHGRTGTGKGTLYSHILQPIFGFEHTQFSNTRMIIEEKNASIEHCLICVVDEFELDDTQANKHAYGILRTYITDPFVTIRGMRKDQKMRPNFTNFLFLSNADIPIKMRGDDRRFNVAPRQEKMLDMDDEFAEALTNELTDFCKYLKSIQITKAEIRKPLMNVSRAKLIKKSRSSHDNIFEAIITGDLDFFTDQLEPNPPISKILQYTAFEQVIKTWINSLGSKCPIFKEDLLRVYIYVSNIKSDNAPSLNKFTTICAHHGVEFSRKRVNKIRRFVFETEWEGEIEDLDLPEPGENIPGTVIPIRKEN